MGCPKCGRFGNKLIRIKDCGLEHCKKCNLVYSFNVRCSLNIDGYIDCYTNYGDVMVGSQKWKELIKELQLPKDAQLVDWTYK